jgi:hypothetical protein
VRLVGLPFVRTLEKFPNTGCGDAGGARTERDIAQKISPLACRLLGEAVKENYSIF